MPINSYLIFAFLLTPIVSTGMKRITQGRKSGELPPDFPEAAPWFIVFDIIRYGVLVWLAILDWKQALSVYVLLLLVEMVTHLLTFFGWWAILLLDPNVRHAARKRP